MIKTTKFLVLTLVAICIVTEAKEKPPIKFIYENSQEENSGSAYRLTRFVHFCVNVNVGKNFEVRTTGEMRVTSTGRAEDPLRNLQRLWDGCNSNSSFPSEFTLKLDSVQLSSAIFSDTAKVTRIKVEGDVDANFNLFHEIRNNHEQLREGCLPHISFDVTAEWGIPECRGLGGVQATGVVKINIFDHVAHFTKLKITKIE